MSDLSLRRGTLLRIGATLPLVALAACSEASSPDAPSGTPSATPTATTEPPASQSPAPQSPSEASDEASEEVPDVNPTVAGTLATGLSVPWGIAFLPDGRALVSSRNTGDVLLVGSGGSGATRVGTVPGVVNNADEQGEAGLLGLALHPDYPATPYLYAYHSTASDNRVVRMTYDGTALGAPEVLLDGIAMSVHHNGGGLVFGPDGSLFVATGDAEDAASAQDTASLSGKVLRLAADGSVPGDNPFGNAVWSYGHRNVEGLAVDTRGRLWAAEFGDKRADELNLIVAGDDYGWPEVEGGDGRGGYADPLAQWATDDCSPGSVAVAAGRAWLGALQGECVFSVVLSGPQKGRVERHLGGEYGRIRSVAAAPDGSLWVGTSNTDGRVTPSAGDDRLLRVTLT